TGIAFSLILPSEGLIPWFTSHISVAFFFLGLFLSDVPVVSQPMRRSLELASRWIFGPMFFISIGWKLNLWQHFDLAQVLLIFFTASLSKFIGAYFSAKSLGYSTKKSSLVGLSLNARGAVEIVLATIALQQSLINQTLFTTLVVMAVVTALLPEPVTHLLKLKEE
ncbi:MAG: cation:proton antiporter, partial [Bdellovibrio sp.]|nr:cation:proton antiporter [Bdellovibrio sp.]